jgi:pimeloyl-ACP methyl ester carboxylesterase
VKTAAILILAASAAPWKHHSGSWHLWLPEADPVRGVFLFNAYGSFKGFSGDPRIRQLGAELGCAVAASDASDYAGALEALSDFARQSARPDLAFAPLFVFGHSNSTHTMAQFAKTVPDRVAAWVAMKSAFGAQFSVPEIYRIPGMVVSGEKDNDYFGDQLATVKKLRKEHGVLMHMIVEANGPHWPTDPTFNIMLAFLKNAFLVRVPPDADPRKGRVKLVELPEKSGWLGRNLDGVRVRLPERWTWEKEVNVRQKLEIGPFEEFPGDRTQASWFPTEDYARKWQEFCLTAAVKDWAVMRVPVKAPAGEARAANGLGLEDLSAGPLAALVKRLNAAPVLKPIVDELRAADTEEAKKILDRVEKRGAGLLGEAREMEAVSPRGAKRMYEAVARRFGGLGAGDAAAARLKEPSFAREVEAWAHLERMARAEESLKEPPGAKRTVADPKFVQANAGPLGTILSEGRLLASRYADTRAAAAGQATLARYGFPEKPRE